MENLQIFLQDWEKQNNPFYPNEMRWNRFKINKMLAEYEAQKVVFPQNMSTTNSQTETNTMLGKVAQHPFTKEEEEIMQLIIKAYSKFANLERGHSMEIQEWVTGIHQLQSILSHRCLRRNFPGYFA